MTLPASGPLSIADLQAEFGGPAAPRDLQDYYRGGAYVPDTAQNASIPTSGAITLPDDFYNTAGQSFFIDGFVSSFDPTNSGASARFRFLSGGTTSATASPNSGSDTPDWAIPAFAGVGNDYDIRATLSSGSTPSSGTLNTWLNLSTTRSWGNSVGSNTSRFTTLLIELRPAGGGSVLASGNVSINAESTF